jgi:hypothetical protein
MLVNNWKKPCRSIYKDMVWFAKEQHLPFTAWKALISSYRHEFKEVKVSSFEIMELNCLKSIKLRSIMTFIWPFNSKLCAVIFMWETGLYIWVDQMK